MSTREETDLKETATDDPVFGRLVWDGFQHAGWAGSFADPHYTGWGGAILALIPDQEKDKAGVEDQASNDFLSTMLTVAETAAGQITDNKKQVRKMVAGLRDSIEQHKAYDGSLDPAPLRKAGRLKVVVPNGRDVKPTEQQRDAWRAFCDGGAKLADEVASALLKVYQQQRPERLRWLAAVDKDAPDKLLPIVNDLRGMRAIVLPWVFGVPTRADGETSVVVVFEALWSNEKIYVSVRDGRVIGVGPFTEELGSVWRRFIRERPEEVESQVFGRLQRGKLLGGWNGVFHSDHLCGFDDASKMRQRYKTAKPLRAMAWRPMPPWEVITGDYGLSVSAPEDGRPSPEQEAAFGAFNADPATTARQILSAIFNWYRETGYEWIEEAPSAKSPEGLLEIIQLQSVDVMGYFPGREATGPREMTMTFGPKAGKKIKLPPLPAVPPGVAIIVNFHWDNEHGVGVRWRNGEIEAVGIWDAVHDV
jgi:hypothetical protein